MIDTCIWIALLRNRDTCHNQAKNIVKNIPHNKLAIYDYLYAETLTVARNKISESACQKFINFFKDCKINIQLTTEDVFTLANFLFFKFKRLSFTDCLLLASAKNNNAQLVTFDKELDKVWKGISINQT
jgi:predicted nucleic acid-binding protein